MLVCTPRADTAFEICARSTIHTGSNTGRRTHATDGNAAAAVTRRPILLDARDKSCVRRLRVDIASLCFILFAGLSIITYSIRRHVANFMHVGARPSSPRQQVANRTYYVGRFVGAVNSHLDAE